ncbi:MAG: extracellular solute-binding protein [Lactobacillaceae bacterium]|jgi:microcin C transport system substrate-binding protein|nr:extracellular solute-binding protein [Lactobacillaceae bacterium]
MMQRTIKTASLSLLMSLICFCAFARDVSIADAIPLYDAIKYDKGFTSFDYVNPNAPKGGKIVMPAYGGFDNFNPYILKGTASAETAGLTLDTLGVQAVDDSTTVYPMIAKKFELPEDKSFVGFFIDENARFSDGSSVTADDVIFSFNAITQKGSPIYKIYYSDVERVEKISDHHVRFIFKEGTNNRELPLIISQISIFSEKDFAGKEFDKPSLTPPLGSGPYVVDKFEAGKYVAFKRSKDYWAKDMPSVKGMYNFDEIRYDYYQDTTVTQQALFAGNIDTRTEYVAKIWVTGYNNEIVKSGKIIKDEINHNNAATLQHFAFNIRKNKFKDKRVREAVGLAFNFDWANEKLFYNQYKRIYSYFTNTGMEATGLPAGKELEILNKFRDALPEEVFTKEPALPSNKNNDETRENLKKAVSLLKEAGYDFVDGKMINLETKEPLEFEVFGNSANGSTFTRVMLPFIDNLKKIGINASFRTLEINVFKNRLDNFDFDMAIMSYAMSQSPGNEQRELWGSQSANVKGSYNKIGIENEIVDKLISGVVRAENKEEYAAYVKALDRVLLNGHYMIPQWYSPFDRVAYWDKFEHKHTDLKIGFQPHTWWMKSLKGINKK